MLTTDCIEKMNLSVIDSFASFSFLAILVVVACVVAFVFDAAQTIHGPRTEHVCYSYF